MQKIPTLFLRNPSNMKLVTREANPDAMWVLAGQGVPTRKKDGTNVRVTIQNERCISIEKRRNPTREEKAQGAEPGYVATSRDDPADQHLIAACDENNYIGWPDGVYPCEALGPKIQGGIEFGLPVLYPFTLVPEVLRENPRTYDEIRDFLARNAIEGIVWQHEDGRMAKIKRRDFGLPWPVKKALHMSMHPDEDKESTVQPSHHRHLTPARVQQIERDFTYHAPKGDQAERYDQLRDQAKELALLIGELTPYSIEQEHALTLLNLSVMSANAAIARNE